VRQLFETTITYFLQEGRDNLQDSLRISFEAALNHDITKLLIFTAEGLGVRLALEKRAAEERFSRIGIVGITFPVAYPFTDAAGHHKRVEISPADRELFHSERIPIVRAHLPFDPILANFKDRGRLGQDLTLVGNALNIFGGSMSLCVQAILLCCDAGVVQPREHVIAMTSDTSILAQACPTREMLTRLAIREILCKPAIYSIGKGESLDKPKEGEGEQNLFPAFIEGKKLPPSTE
jgi:hypothetical protein